MERNGETENSAPWWPETGGRNEDEGLGISGNLFSVLFALNDDDAVLLDFVINNFWNLSDDGCDLVDLRLVWNLFDDGCDLVDLRLVFDDGFCCWLTALLQVWFCYSF